MDLSQSLSYGKSEQEVSSLSSFSKLGTKRKASVRSLCIPYFHVWHSLRRTMQQENCFTL